MKDKADVEAHKKKELVKWWKEQVNDKFERYKCYMHSGVDRGRNPVLVKRFMGKQV